ncbi:hypothetical protein [Streptomyces sp. NPDC051776]|uniref:hypothetical protein n=1 Tax=Streptomyces sp. NPDC051776 TaxID=3155414 RepID=UPI003418B187
MESQCSDRDFTFSKYTFIKGSGARAEGGSSTASTAQEQNIAQEGRQNNTCTNLNSAILNVTGGGRMEGRCKNRDHSLSKHTLIKGGGARSEGGSSTGIIARQQYIAQVGRQNNACNNFNSSGDIDVTGGRTEAGCQNRDHSFSKHTYLKGGGAHAEGGSSTGGSVEQQNLAQEGRQNNACNNLNNAAVTVEGSRSGVGCKTADHSANLHTADIGGGAEVEGGSSTVSLFQQNIAQEGRLNNTCANPNNLTLTATGGSRSATQCSAVDRSTNIGSVNQ